MANNRKRKRIPEELPYALDLMHIGGPDDYGALALLGNFSPMTMRKRCKTNDGSIVFTEKDVEDCSASIETYCFSSAEDRCAAVDAIRSMKTLVNYDATKHNDVLLFGSIDDEYADKMKEACSIMRQILPFIEPICQIVDSYLVVQAKGVVRWE